MCNTCGCGNPKDKHGMKTLTAADKRYANKKVAQENEVMKNMTAGQMVEYKRKEKKRPKSKSREQDAKYDSAISKRIKKK